MLFTIEKWSYGKPRHAWRENWQAEASRLFIFKMSERFVDVGSVDSFIEEQENKATLQKTQRDVKVLQTFLGTRNELRKVEEIPALELNEYICEYIYISVRTKDGKDDEPSSLQSLLQVLNDI